MVLDLNGTMRDWAWLRAKYGDVSYLEAAQYPKFQLIKVEEMEGPQAMMVNLEAENGAPHSGQPVVLSWPSLAEPSADIPAIPAGSKSCYTSARRHSADRERLYGFRPGRWQLYQRSGCGRALQRLRTFALDVLRLSDGYGLAGRHESHGAVPADVSDCARRAWRLNPSLSLALTVMCWSSWIG